MDSSDLLYIIPPYLLNTCLGSNLQQELSSKDKELSLLNVISVDSPNYYNKVNDVEIQANQFSSDPIIHQIIMDKLIYKLSIVGALGDNPMEFSQRDETYLFELFETFKHRLTEEVPEQQFEDSDNNDDMTSNKAKPSKFSSQKLGEVNLENVSPNKQLPNTYRKYLGYSLKDLLILSKFETNNKYKLPSSLIRFDDGSFFNYPLPLSWIPLISNQYLNFLNKNLNLTIDCGNGYSSIKLSSQLSEDTEKLEEPNKNKYYNFISDKSISPSCGIFYYEIQINQQATEATHFKPILVMNDVSTSSDSSLNVSAGYTKRFINIDSQPPSSSSSSSSPTTNKIDLETIINDIIFNHNEVLNKSSTGEIESLLNLRPGEFRGSFAVNFEDSTFYNSIKSSESIQRSAILNMNRRLSSLNRSSLNELDSGKIDIGIPFKTYSSNENKSKKFFKTDIVGCGINFIDKSIFITLNGVLVRVITKDELMSNNSSNDNLFSDDKDNLIYPMIGFKINELNIVNNADSTKLDIKTNLGFKEFKFNINNYVKNFRNETQKFLYLLDKNTKVSSNTPLEKLLLNINDDSKLLNKLIKGYLNHEGYLETFKAFDSDLKNLSKEINMDDETDDSIILNTSHALNRQILKSYILKNQFDHALKFLYINYSKVFDNEEGKNIIFELNLFKYTHLLKTYLEAKFNFDDSGMKQEFFAKAYNYSYTLQSEYKEDITKLRKINEISSLLLVNSKEALNNLTKVNNSLNNYSKNLNLLLSEINKKILKSLGFNKISNLEKIFDNVNKNINLLSLKYNDDKFMLINFEKDHMDL